MRNIVRARVAAAAIASLIGTGAVRGGMAGMEHQRPPIEAVFYNGRIHTMETALPVAEAVAVGAGRIVAVGDSEAILARAGKDAARYDLCGMNVLPGLIDAHTHFSGYAVGLEAIDLRGAASPQEIARIVSARAASMGRHEWVLGRGWDQNEWPDPSFPHRRDLDDAAGGRPVLLVRVCGHAALAGTAALERAGIGRDTPDPPGGRIGRDAAGEATGLLIDTAIDLVRALIPPPDRADKRRLFAAAARDCLAAGLTGVHEMGIGSETVSLYREMYAAGELPLRITAYYDGGAADLDSVLNAGPLLGAAGGRFSLVGVKYFADGSLGARSAALLEEYADDPGNTGLLVTEPERLRKLVHECHSRGFQAAIHAIGDRANRIVLDIFAGLPQEGPSADRRHRIEHAQIVSAPDIARFATLGVVPSMQFIHCTSDMAWAAARLGAARLGGAYAWRSLLEAGCRIAAGSDFPVEPLDPLPGIYAAVTRATAEGYPAGGWLPGQRLTAHEALRAFTLDAARAAHQEHDRGSIAAGKAADFIVVSTDILNAPPRGILETQVVLTVLGGEVVHRAAGAPF